MDFVPSRAPWLTVSASGLERLTKAKNLREEKAELRRRMRRARQGIPADQRARMAEIVADRLFALPEAASARTLLLFYSFGSEVATAGMAARVRAEGKRLLLPYVEDAMEAAEVREGDELVRAPYGAREPARRVPVDPAAVEVVVTPGLAFDLRGNRLGYGGGYYDRYLARLRSDTVRIGIGYAVQIVDRVPAGPADQPVDLVVTEADVIDCRPS
jgi:5-formyltetrahydrofolate cyclo-ligase